MIPVGSNAAKANFSATTPWQNCQVCMPESGED